MEKRIHNLDPLRGFLALSVVIYHIPQLSKSIGLAYFDSLAIFQKGPQAVSVFFCLSGFLIVGLLHDEKRQYGSISIKQFYVRRILRLYPVYYLVLVFGLIYYHLILPFFNVSYELSYSFIEGLVWNVFFLPNVFKALYDPGAILEILWSIGIEEQFYLIIAPLLTITPLKKYHHYLFLFTGTYFVIFHLDVFFFLKKFHLLYFYMSAGGLMAVLSKKGLTLYFKSYYLRILIYAIFLIYFFTNFLHADNDLIRHSIDVILFNMLIINLANEDKFIIRNKLLNYMGNISYGIYMYHLIVVNFILFLVLKYDSVHDLNDWQTILIINFTSVLLTIFVSHLSFKYYESYFLSLKKKFRKI
ncbi:acyltransferase family protein [Ekhidna sp.]